MSDTPRTNATFNRTMKFAGKVDACEVFADFARQLERELNALRAAGDELWDCCHVESYTIKAESAMKRWKELTR